MEIEVKLRIKDEPNYTKLKTIISKFHTKTLTQKNHFFDTENQTLSSKCAVLRLRFVNNETQCILSLKSKPLLVNGVSKVEEDEEIIDPKMGLICLESPDRFRSIGSRIIKRCEEEFGVSSENGLVGLGGFENLREVYLWNGLKLEVDLSKFEFGVLYEIECENSEAESVKKVIEEFLEENGVEFECSVLSKFAIFRSGKLP